MGKGNTMGHAICGEMSTTCTTIEHTWALDAKC